jgi:hypothetical protein
MLNKVIFAACALALSTSPLLAGHHKGPMGPPPAGIMIPLPAGAMMPAPEEGPDKLADFVLDHLDKDGDGKISKDELLDALKGGMPHHGDSDGDSDGDSEMSGISEGDEGLESLPHPEECGETLTSSEMGPIAEGVSCGSSHSVGPAQPHRLQSRALQLQRHQHARGARRRLLPHRRDQGQ